MTTVIVDASLAGAWFLQDEASVAADRLLRAALSGEVALAAPELWTYEILNLLASALKRRRLDEASVFEALAVLNDIPIELHDHRERLARERALRLAVRFGLSAYDAAYLELADRLQQPLCANDAKLADAARKLGLLQKMP